MIRRLDVIRINLRRLILEGADGCDCSGSLCGANESFTSYLDIGAGLFEGRETCFGDG